MQDNQTLTTIKAKQKLGLPLTDHERAMFALYGENAPVTDAETAARAELCATIIAPILDVLVPIIDAIALRIKHTSVEETAAAMSEYGKKAAFVEKYLSPLLVAADMQIKSASYRCHIATSEEYVDIIYIGGHKRRVCVTADSLQALILDVMR